MSSEVVSQLIDMGFEAQRAEYAVKKAGNSGFLILFSNLPFYADYISVDAALQWLEDNQEKDLEEIKSADAPDVTVTPVAGDSASNEESVARSFVCNECGKSMRDTEAMQYHAAKSYVYQTSKYLFYSTVTN